MSSPSEAGKILREYYANVTLEQFLADVRKSSLEILEGSEFEVGTAAQSKPLVFIAYTRDNEPLAERLAADLQADNFRVGLREQGNTDDQRRGQSAESGPERADAVVVLLAPRKSESKALRPYVDLALAHGTRVLLLASRESQVPSSLRDLERVQLRESYEDGYRQVRGTLRHDH